MQAKLINPAPERTLALVFDAADEVVSLTTTNVAGVQNLPISIYITENDTVTQFTGDPASIPLLSHRHTAIVLGTPIVQVPLFAWPAN